MAMSFIGKPISLISHSDVRYRGILAGIDAVNSTIQLQNVYSMGTENRRPPAEFIPPAEQPYQYIIFRASEVKDLAVDPVEAPPPRRSVHDDPAVLGASAGPPVVNNTYAAYPQTDYPSQPSQQTVAPDTQASRQLQASQPSLGTRATPSAPLPTESTPQAPQPVPATSSGQEQGAGGSSNSGRRSASNSVHSAAASLETVERALGDLRLAQAQVHANGNRGNGRRGGRGPDTKAEIKVPTTDFDFESANARFDKVKDKQENVVSSKKDEDEKTNPSDEEPEDGESNAKATKKEAEQDKAYNPQKSFFDSLSSSANAQPPSRGRGGASRRGQGRLRREEEREKNVATFGEPGGVGLMGPGAYVGGWGGYGRRGGGRGGRRGNPPSGGR